MTRRLKSCVEQWPECEEGSYSPKCCRFPKSCSCTVYSEDISDEYLEPEDDMANIQLKIPKQMDEWDYFKLEYDPIPGGKFGSGYWTCTAKPDYDGTGLTPLDAMADCMISMSKALIRQEGE